jgi:formamidopyrimidine-DNA glycosylase
MPELPGISAYLAALEERIAGQPLELVRSHCQRVPAAYGTAAADLCAAERGPISFIRLAEFDEALS